MSRRGPTARSEYHTDLATVFFATEAPCIMLSPGEIEDSAVRLSDLSSSTCSRGFGDAFADA